jgi:flagellar biosynthesis protein FliP
MNVMLERASHIAMYRCSVLVTVGLVNEIVILCTSFVESKVTFYLPPQLCSQEVSPSNRFNS